MFFRKEKITPTEERKKEFKKFNISTISNNEIIGILSNVGDKKIEEIPDEEVSRFRDSLALKGEFYVNFIDAKFYIKEDGDIELAYSNREGAKKNAESFGLRVMGSY